MNFIVTALAMAMALAQGACAQYDRTSDLGQPSRDRTRKTDEASTVNIRFRIGDKVATGTLEGGAAARDFVSQLPLTLTLEDYHSTELISYLPRKLSTTGEPEGIDPAVGDITYYAPWGNLALFYKDFGYSKGLVKLGRIESGLEFLTASSPGRVTIELDE
jgi:hypothetical protein